MPEPLVVVRELHKSFLHMGHELEVLRGIDLRIDEGEIVAIVGKSGAGKSTLLHCIGTLDMPTSGVIRIAKHELVGLSDAELAEVRNKMIGFVFQFHHLLPEFNALENVMMPGTIQGMGRERLEKRARDLLNEVGLAHRATHRPGELSGGEQQRVALARALLLEPKLILADEPTGNLDTGTSDAIHELFFDINQKHGTTIVVVTHNVKLAQSMPRTITMLDGKVESDTKPPISLPTVDERLLDRSKQLARAKAGTFWPRAGARIIDFVFHNLLAFGASFAMHFALLSSGFEEHSAAVVAKTLSFTGVAILLAVGFLADVASRVVYEGIGQASLGKLLLGLRVRRETLEHAGPKAALLRNLAMIVDGLLFGLVAYMAMSGSLLQQRIGDRLGRTIVVQSKSLDRVDEASVWGGVALGAVVYVVLLVAGWLSLLLL
jgi:lipoprotein-releasing system ATP-binding protein